MVNHNRIEIRSEEFGFCRLLWLRQPADKEPTPICCSWCLGPSAKSSQVVPLGSFRSVVPMVIVKQSNRTPLVSFRGLFQLQVFYTSKRKQSTPAKQQSRLWRKRYKYMPPKRTQSPSITQSQIKPSRISSHVKPSRISQAIR